MLKFYQRLLTFHIRIGLIVWEEYIHLPGFLVEFQCVNMTDLSALSFKIFFLYLGIRQLRVFKYI